MTTNQSPESCNKDCQSCGSDCSERTLESFRISLHPRSSVKKTIGVVSGKGGVGKSIITALLACEMQRRGRQSAVLDGDITGPCQAKLFGVTAKAEGDGELILPALTESGIQLISTNMLLDDETQPLIWRGPMVANILKQFYQEVYWRDVDYMFIDMPPGTSDVPLTLFQSIPLDGIIVVTSPQEVVGMVVEKAVNMARMMHIGIIGLVENMAYVKCPHCGEKNYVFGQGHVEEEAQKYGLKVLASLPLEGNIAKDSDSGKIEFLSFEEIKAVGDILENI